MTRPNPRARRGRPAAARGRWTSWPAIGRRLLPATALSRLKRSGTVRSLWRRRRNVAVMFVDIQGCTQLCEDLSLREMNRVMEAYFSRYLDIVQAGQGEVTEVLGDGLVALFEGPSLRADATRAVSAALRIQAATRELNAKERHRHAAIVANVGLSAGAELIGITVLRGQSVQRWFYRAIGPVTNLAARLCALAEQGQILVTRAMVTWPAGACRLRALGSRVLKNVRGPVEVFEVLPLGGGPESRRGGRERRRTA